VDIAGNRTLYSVFASYAELQPGKEWLVFDRDDQVVQRWGYATFLATVQQAAHLLLAHGIGPGDTFNLHLANHPAHLQLMLAASYLGAVAVPTNPVSTAGELGYVVRHSASKLIVTETACLEIVEQVSREIGGLPIVLVGGTEPIPAGYPVYEVELTQQPTSEPAQEGSAEQVVQLLYTSGTTARPKGVMLTNASLIYGAEVFRAASGLCGDDRHLIALPLFHAAAQCHALWPSLIAGASVALLSRFSASRYFEQAIEREATMAALFGAPLRMLLNQPSRPTDAAHRLRNVTFAQNLTPDQYESWHARFKVPLQQLWGMTETVGLPVMSPLTGWRNLSAMGRPVVGYEVKVVDDDGHEVPVGATGQLIVRGQPGRSLMLGYLNNAEATQRTLRSDATGTWLYSGDTVRADENGFISFVDRGKDLIKRAGENISSTEVETAILDCPGVLDVCVVGVPDPIRDEALVAVVVRKPGANVSADQIRAFCAQRLAAFKVPGQVEFVDTLPRTSVGKIQKNLVRERLGETPAV
jgi:crotonobetaine/carnitine-CoA ligase